MNFKKIKAMVIGNKSFPVNILPDPTVAHELYMGTSGVNIEHVASVTHRAAMKQVLSQEDKSRFRSRTEAAEREKNARRIELLDGPSVPSPRKGGTPARRVVSPSSHRASPRPGATPTPTAATTSTPTLTNTTTTTPASTSSSLRERLIHLLAIQPLPLIQLTTPLRTRDDDLIPILKKVASSSKGNWRLRPEIYPEIRIWEWRYDEKERNIVLKNAHEAYNTLKLPRNAPERSNLAPKKPQHLVPPPAQRRPSADASPPRKRPAATTNDTTTPAPKKKKKQKTKNKSSSAAAAAAAVPQVAQSAPTPTPAPAPPALTTTAPDTSSESDDEFGEPFAMDRITSQAEFLAACKRHDDAQAEYTHLKGKISKEHPQYLEALVHVDGDAMTDDEDEMRISFYRKLRIFYLSHGGTQAQWRSVIRLCRQFNWTMAKVNTMWDEIERAYAENHFSLPANAKNI
ncbi:hypothetical protein BDB00DRAFT_831182 [Zychaea mexicana]|uniref:uncharacterized protein n=1 Tax=Zychaea mexicana TaxID=64656 RepID=UPI0022FE3F12|nr:uncharacterized protein BDB00DRAFT_831182 [Zychaea mexicana]KAI9491923.1 hypothetical protein BDB00DRAFT_831182 [Zychaea mexicana]